MVSCSGFGLPMHAQLLRFFVIHKFHVPASAQAPSAHCLSVCFVCAPALAASSSLHCPGSCLECHGPGTLECEHSHVVMCLHRILRLFATTLDSVSSSGLRGMVLHHLMCDWQKDLPCFTASQNSGSSAHSAVTPHTISQKAWATRNTLALLNTVTNSGTKSSPRY